MRVKNIGTHPVEVSIRDNGDDITLMEVTLNTDQQLDLPDVDRLCGEQYEVLAVPVLKNSCTVEVSDAGIWSNSSLEVTTDYISILYSSDPDSGE